jgi:urease accessory protein
MTALRPVATVLTATAGARTEAIEGRHGRFDLAFHRVGATTRLGAQFVSYPFHMTRPFALDPALPALATVYQQSASGGLYRGDRMATRIEVGAAAAVHLTTQSATIVHDTRGHDARLGAALTVADGGFLAATPDPMVLFPGAGVATTTEIRLGPGAVACVSEAFVVHDPRAAGGTFARLAAATTVREASGRLLFTDRFELAGADLLGARGAIGARRLVATHLLLGPRARLPEAAALEAAIGGEGCVAGLLDLPNATGVAVRVLADDAIAERRVAAAIFRLAVRAALGADPVPRRK